MTPVRLLRKAWNIISGARTNFFLIGRNPNTIVDALHCLSHGANGLEPDIHHQADVDEFYVCHGNVSDGDPTLREYLTELSKALPANHPLALIAFDLKAPYDYKLVDLYEIIRTYFSNAHRDVAILTTVPHWDDKIRTFFSGLGPNYQRQNEAVGVDEYNNPEKFYAEVKGLGLNTSYAMGIDNQASAQYQPILQRGMTLRKRGGFSIVYSWAANSTLTQREYLDLNPRLDALIAGPTEGHGFAEISQLSAFINGEYSDRFVPAPRGYNPFRPISALGST